MSIFTEVFDQEPQKFAAIKGAQRVQINSILSAISITIIAILITNSATKISNWIIIQLAISIPFLITSSLFFTKTSYRPAKEYNCWNTAASITHSIGYFAVLNSISLLMYFKGYESSAWVFMITVISLIMLYSILDYSLNKKRAVERVVKFFLYAAIISAGTIPMLTQLFNRLF